MIFCSLYSGSSGNCILVGSEKTKVLIDVGVPGKKVIEALERIKQDPKEIKGIFVTHEHGDHIKGVGIISRKFNIPIYANEATWNEMKSKIGNIKENNINIIEKRSLTTIEDLNIQAFNIPHDAVSAMGYTITDSNGNKSSIVTDLGTFTDEIRQNIKDSDIILLEANHDIEMVKFGPYHYELKRRVLSEVGHLCNEDCADALVDIMSDKKFRRVVLGHLSNTNNVPELAYRAVVNILAENGLNYKEDLKLTIAKRHEPSNYIEI
ncbi:MAG: MBL fold metallo-hydrolase [Sarcina sp.]